MEKSRKYDNVSNPSPPAKIFCWHPCSVSMQSLFVLLC